MTALLSHISRRFASFSDQRSHALMLRAGRNLLAHPTQNGARVAHELQDRMLRSLLRTGFSGDASILGQHIHTVYELHRLQGANHHPMDAVRLLNEKLCRYTPSALRRSLHSADIAAYCQLCLSTGIHGSIRRVEKILTSSNTPLSNFSISEIAVVTRALGLESCLTPAFDALLIQYFVPLCKAKCTMSIRDAGDIFKGLALGTQRGRNSGAATLLAGYLNANTEMLGKSFETADRQDLPTLMAYLSVLSLPSGAVSRILPWTELMVLNQSEKFAVAEISIILKAFSRIRHSCKPGLVSSIAKRLLSEGTARDIVMSLPAFNHLSGEALRVMLVQLGGRLAEGWGEEVEVAHVAVAVQCFARHRVAPPALIERIETEVLCSNVVWDAKDITIVAAAFAALHIRSPAVDGMLSTEDKARELFLETCTSVNSGPLLSKTMRRAEDFEFNQIR